MRLLILTQAVDRNDPVLGFFHQWIKEFARNTDEVIVGCLRMGEYELPGNVRVVSLGKERGASRWEIIRNFYRLIVREQKHYDAVFVHMNPEYVVLGGIPWRLLGKRVALWYTHKHVDLKLRVAETLAHVIFTASEESLRLATPKKRVMGHGIDTKFFHSAGSVRSSGQLDVLTIGRVSPTKGYETLIDATEMLLSEGIDVHVTVVGGAGTPAQERYFQEMRKRADQPALQGRITFTGPVEHTRTLDYLQKAQVFVSMSQTGSLDKAILEAMATELPVVSCNDAAASMFRDDHPELLFAPGNARDLADTLKNFARLSPAEREALGREMRAVVVERHTLPSLISNIIHHFSLPL